MHTILPYLTSELMEITQETSTVFGGIVIGLLLVFMLLTCFFGFRMKKIWISVLGVLIGFTLGALIGVLINQGTALIIICGLVSAIIGGVIAFKLYRVGMFIWTGSLAFSMVYDLLARFLDIREMAPAILVTVVSLGVGILIGILTLRFMRPVTIVVTSVSGGLSSGIYLTVIGSSLFHYSIEAPAALFALLGIGVLLAALGMAVQFHNKKA